MAKRVVVATIAPDSPGKAPFPGWMLQLEMINCGRCRRCKIGGFPHGPYWYRYRKGTSKYVGKIVPGIHKLQPVHPSGSQMMLEFMKRLTKEHTGRPPMRKDGLTRGKRPAKK